MYCIILILFHLNLLCNIYSMTEDNGSFGNYEEYDDYITDIDEEDIDNEPIMLTAPRIIGAKIGEYVFLPCEVNSSDLIMRVWRRGDYLLYQDDIKLQPVNVVNNIDILTNGTLKVKVQSDQDGNEYTCQLLSILGMGPNVTHKIFLMDSALLELPNVKSTPKIFEVIVGETVYLPCRVSLPSTHETDHIQRVWKKDKVLYINRQKYSNVKNVNILAQGTLEIKTESESDTSNYTCEIEWAKNYQKVSYQILVFPKLTTEQKKIEVNVGETIILPCDISYNNVLFNIDIDHINRNWTKDHELLYYGKFKYTGGKVNLLHDGSLKVTIDSFDDLNEYSCSVVSANGTIDKITHTVLARNRVVPTLLTKPRVFNTKVGETLLLPCEISYPYDDATRNWIRVNYLRNSNLKLHAADLKFQNGTLKVHIEKDDNLAEYTCTIKTSSKSRVQNITHRIKIISSSAQHISSVLTLVIVYLFNSIL